MGIDLLNNYAYGSEISSELIAVMVLAALGVTAAPAQPADPGAERLAAVLGIDEAQVQLYAPLLLPLGLEFGGFIFLAFGFAPRRQIAVHPAVISTETPVVATEPVASANANHRNGRRHAREGRNEGLLFATAAA
jgi:hypothetical protein